MTKEEAKQIFLSRGYVEVEGVTIYDPDKWREACVVISDWLEQEPCEDAISRQAAIDAINTAWTIDDLDNLTNAMLTDTVKSLPSVTPQPEIVRCSQCKYAEVADLEDSQDGYTCQFHRGSIWFSGSYCSWAERRQDG